MKKLKKTNKYHNQKVEFEGITFDSKREKERYEYLKSLVEENKIYALSVHPKWELIPKITEDYEIQLKTKKKKKTRTLQQPITYTADFEYYYDTFKKIIHVVEDVKPSPKIPLPKEFILKKKLMFWKYGIEVKIVYDSKEKVEYEFRKNE